ncbi:protein obstructor-E-like [Anopheles funestus]|uniref:protein obstructor-E-like n=1 Tax=Anopheles funestus TaxID=62324 RepID=UPI0020C64FBD|nr:protein obstructor-E-like [Anopheles funestus]
MNKKLCILLVLVVFCSATLAGKSKETSKEKSKENSKEKSKEDSDSKEKSNESSSKEVPNTEAPATTTVASSDRCAGQPDGTILPSLTACANFVTCQGEAETAEATCVPSGTIFDSTRGVCDYEPNALCTIEGETTTEAAAPEPEPTTAPEPTQNELKGMCKGVIIDMISHPGNCNKYIICVLGKPNIQSCGKNQVFYSDIKLCAFGDPKTC